MRTAHRRPFGTTLALGLVATLLAACAAGGGGAVASPDGSAAPTETPPPALPTNPDALVLQVRDEGGFVMPQYNFSRTPQISVYADGRVIQQGAQVLMFPGPILPPLFVSTLDEATLLSLLEQAAAAGLASGANAAYPATTVADAPDTVFAVRGQNGLTETSFGAFGIEQTGLAAAEVEARRAATAFLGALQAAVSAAPGGASFTPAAIRLLVADYVAQADFPQEPVDWPLATSLATGGTAWFPGQPEMGRCLVVEGADLETLWPALGAANALTPFASDGKQYALTVRPLLPDEEPICP